MKPLDEQDHYEVLEVSEDATLDDIERAYRMVRATYDDASPAVYSILEGADLDAIRTRIDEAYGVLSDLSTRRRYDALRLGGEALEPDAESVELSIGLIPPPPPESVAPRLEGFEDFEADADAPTFDGACLRRARLCRGLEVQDIARITKVSSTHLHFLEDERFGDLPAPVYVRGFVSAYARCVGLDPEIAARSYMEHYEAARDENGGTWFRGRR